MAGRFEGKVCVVTGGGRGIGRATASLFAQEGARVVVNDLGSEVRGGGADATIAQAAVDEIKSVGGDAIANGADVSTVAGAKSVIDAAMERYGRVDAVFNGAGILRPMRIDRLDENVWDQIIDVCLKSCYGLLHAAAPHMIEQRSGAFVFASSPSGWGHYGMAAYAAAKEGIIGLTRSVARELGEFGIRVNAVRPAANTRMLLPEVVDDAKYVQERYGCSPLGNQWIAPMSGGKPDSEVENVAAVVAWLCTDLAEPLNGRDVYIAGGHVALGNEPELLRSRFKPEGWDFDSMCTEEVVTHLTYGQKNFFPARN